MIVLAGDVGGTKSLLALVERSATGRTILAERRYESTAFPALAPMVADFLAETAAAPAAACFGVPGAVVDGVCRTPNLPWVITVEGLRRETGVPRVRLINDFMAAALGVPLLHAGDLLTLQAGQPEADGPRAILGAGTGLGQAVLMPGGDGSYRVLATEAGHADWAPRGARQRALLAFLEEHFPEHVSVERVVSGPGLASILDFIAAEVRAPKHAARQILEREPDRAAAIAALALSGRDRACLHALELFVAAYGQEAGNLALRSLPTGGLYVAGGIAPKLAETLRDGAFIQAFLAKGRLRPLLARIPVYLVLEARIGLLGAAACAAQP